MSLPENDKSSVGLSVTRTPAPVLHPEAKALITPAKAAKRAFLTAFGAAGGFSLVKASTWRTTRLLILGYHGISLHDEHLWNPSLFMHPDEFARRMETIRRKGYRVIALDEALDRLAAGDLPPASVSITFDDGLYCFHKNALPLLESFAFPSTLYFTTFYSEFQEPVFDVLCGYMVWKSRGKTLDLRPITGEDRKFNLDDAAQREAACVAILTYAIRARLSALQKVQLSEQLASVLSFDLDSVKQNRLLNLMTPAEAADSASRGVSIELHTHRHRTPLDRGEFLQEIDDNRREIQKITGRVPLHFCYPSGHYNPAFEPWLAERGIRSATTCDPGFVKARTPPLYLPRLVDVSGMDGTEFEAWLSGTASALPRRELPSRHETGPPGFVVRAQSACRDALLSPSFRAVDAWLRQLDPTAELGETWLRTLCKEGAWPPDARAAIVQCAPLNSSTPLAAERVILLRSALRSLDRLGEARLDPATQARLCSQYEFFANPGAEWIPRFNPAAYSYRAYAQMCLLERFPAGRLDWVVSGIPRSWLLRIPRRDLPRVLGVIVTELSGFKPAIDAHLAFQQSVLDTFQEHEVNASYVQIARAMALRPEIRAIVVASWLYSSETHRVSPHLRWTTRLFEENGAVISDLGKAPEDGGFLVGSKQRRDLYESGAYRPTEGLIIWPRRAVLDWLAKQKPGPDAQPAPPAPAPNAKVPKASLNGVDRRIQRIFQEVFENDALQLGDDLSSDTMSDWDSLAQVKLILGLEEEFGVKFTTAEVTELHSVASLKTALERKTSSAS